MSDDDFEIGWLNEKLRGPIGVEKSTAIPVALLIELESLTFVSL